jgi:hypothetical protein
MGQLLDTPERYPNRTRPKLDSFETTVVQHLEPCRLADPEHLKSGFRPDNDWINHWINHSPVIRTGLL